MARPSQEKKNIELERMLILHSEQEKVRKRIQKETRIKKGGYHLPGEIKHKKDLAVFLKIGVPGISFTEIANRLGETKGTVKKWFKEDPDVREFYQWALANLKQGAISLIETYGFEAIETQVLLMRFGSEKYMFEASREILDRMGVIKTTRQEIEAQHKNTHEWSDREQLVNEIRELAPEQQEEAIEALERFEQLLSEHASSNGNGNGEEPEAQEEEFEEEVDSGE